MQDRINIDGVWYVREKKSTAMAAPPKEVDPNDYEWEAISHRGIEINNYNKRWKLEVSILDAGDMFSMPSIELLRKPMPDSDWEGDEVIDNEIWIRDIANRVNVSLDELSEYEPDLQAAIIYACDQMKKKGWI